MPAGKRPKRSRVGGPENPARPVPSLFVLVSGSWFRSVVDDDDVRTDGQKWPDRTTKWSMAARGSLDWIGIGLSVTVTDVRAHRAAGTGRPPRD